MREQVEALDQHVIARVKDILDAGLIPLVVGEDSRTYIHTYIEKLSRSSANHINSIFFRWFNTQSS